MTVLALVFGLGLAIGRVLLGEGPVPAGVEQDLPRSPVRSQNVELPVALETAGRVPVGAEAQDDDGRVSSKADQTQCLEGRIVDKRTGRGVRAFYAILECSGEMDQIMTDDSGSFWSHLACMEEGELQVTLIDTPGCSREASRLVVEYVPEMLLEIPVDVGPTYQLDLSCGEDLGQVQLLAYLGAPDGSFIMPASGFGACVRSEGKHWVRFDADVIGIIQKYRDPRIWVYSADGRFVGSTLLDGDDENRLYKASLEVARQQSLLLTPITFRFGLLGLKAM